MGLFNNSLFVQFLYPHNRLSLHWLSKAQGPSLTPYGKHPLNPLSLLLTLLQSTKMNKHKYAVCTQICVQEVLKICGFNLGGFSLHEVWNIRVSWGLNSLKKWKSMYLEDLESLLLLFYFKRKLNLHELPCTQIYRQSQA